MLSHFSVPQLKPPTAKSNTFKKRLGHRENELWPEYIACNCKGSCNAEYCSCHRCAGVEVWGMGSGCREMKGAASAAAAWNRCEGVEVSSTWCETERMHFWRLLVPYL
eukprot:353358-Chlamydomonas_euryale.AAC.4